MKKFYSAIGVLVLLSILASGAILLLSPDIIPVHYNAAGEVDRMGSKFEMLIFPGFGLSITASLIFLHKNMRKKNAPEAEQKILLGTAIFELILFNALGLFFGIAGIRYGGAGVTMRPELIIPFTGMGAGVMLIFLGCMMPRAGRNALFGLRTKWSMANDRVWEKSQRFGGLSAAVCGLVTIALAATVRGRWTIMALGAAALVWVTACVIASYCYWKRDRAEHGE